MSQGKWDVCRRLSAVRHKLSQFFCLCAHEQIYFQMMGANFELKHLRTRYIFLNVPKHLQFSNFGWLTNQPRCFKPWHFSIQAVNSKIINFFCCMLRLHEIIVEERFLWTKCVGIYPAASLVPPRPIGLKMLKITWGTKILWNISGGCCGRAAESDWKA